MLVEIQDIDMFIEELEQDAIDGCVHENIVRHEIVKREISEVVIGVEYELSYMRSRLGANVISESPGEYEKKYVFDSSLVRCTVYTGQDRDGMTEGSDNAEEYSTAMFNKCEGLGLRLRRGRIIV